jgi:hypothetical protein
MKLGEKIGVAIWGATAVSLITMLVLVMTGLERRGNTAGDVLVGVLAGGFLLGLVAIFWPEDLFTDLLESPKRRERRLQQQTEQVQRDLEQWQREAPPRKYGD